LTLDLGPDATLEPVDGEEEDGEDDQEYGEEEKGVELVL